METPRQPFTCFVPSPPETQEAFLRAAEDERFHRLVPFLGLTETIGPVSARHSSLVTFECVPITLRHLALFRISENTCFLESGVPLLEHVVAFLWVLHPENQNLLPLRHQMGERAGVRWLEKLRRAHLQKCKALFAPIAPPRRLKFLRPLWAWRQARRTLNFQETVGRIRQYIDQTFQDSGISHSDGRAPQVPNFKIEYYSDIAAIVAEFGRDNHFSMEQTLNTPLSILFQIRRANRHYAHGAKAGLSNRSSELLHIPSPVGTGEGGRRPGEGSREKHNRN